jgi:hypothetical protein
MGVVTADDVGGMAVTRGVTHDQACVFGFSKRLSISFFG